jgi:hypothetical protein
MSGKQPETIFTDQRAVFIKAILAVFSKHQTSSLFVAVIPK